MHFPKHKFPVQTVETQLKSTVDTHPPQNEWISEGKHVRNKLEKHGHQELQTISPDKHQHQRGVPGPVTTSCPARIRVRYGGEDLYAPSVRGVNWLVLGLSDLHGEGGGGGGGGSVEHQAISTGGEKIVSVHEK